MFSRKIIIVGKSLGIILPKSMLKAEGASRGDEFIIVSYKILKQKKEKKIKVGEQPKINLVL